MTNRDKINCMSNIELSALLYSLIACESHCFCGDCLFHADWRACKNVESIKKWLESEFVKIS